MPRWNSLVSGSAVIAALCLSGCFGTVTPPPVVVSRAHVYDTSLYDPERDRFLPWAEDTTQLIIVDKQSRELVLYRNGRAVKTYPVVLGRNLGRKRHEGDRRTPSGLYEITDKHRSEKYDRFMALSYPNDDDRAQFQAAVAAGRISGVQLTPGGLIGIHGTDKDDFNRLGINWTFGCISLANRDVEELYGEVGEGTPVLIHDDQQP